MRAAEAEVLVIGGGPAGWATAIAAAQLGLPVELAEPCGGALDKCCGEGLLPAAVTALKELGIGAAALAEFGEPMLGIRFHHAGRQAEARFSAATGAALGMRRTALHALLSRRAAALGVRRTTASARLETDEHGFRVLLGSERRRPRWIVGADGAQSAIRAGAGLDHGHVASRRFALRRHFRLAAHAASPRFVEVHWAADAHGGTQAYVTPVGEGIVGVAVLAGSKLRHMDPALAQNHDRCAQRRFSRWGRSLRNGPVHDCPFGYTYRDSALAPFPAVAQLLQGALPCTAPRGAVTTHRTLDRVYRDNVALVGDASGGVDAITGDGLALSFQQALALGAALRAGDLNGYGAAHKRLSRTARAMSHTLLGMGAHPILVGAGIFFLEHVPGLFAALLHLHTRPPSNVRSPFPEKPPCLPAPTSIGSTT